MTSVSREILAIEHGSYLALQNARHIRCGTLASSAALLLLRACATLLHAAFASSHGLWLIKASPDPCRDMHELKRIANRHAQHQLWNDA